MRAWLLSIKNSFSRLKAETFKLRAASLHNLTSLPVPEFSPEAAAALREVFQASGFTTASSEGSSDRNPALATLVRLFVHAEVITVDEAARVLSPLKLDELIHSGLLHRDGGLVQSLLQAQSYQGLIFFSDLRYHEHAEDYVLPVGPSGTHMARITIRRPVQSALDLGCGCGLQSLLTAQHCARVTATDINPRALAMTRLNAVLNGVTNIELLEGSYLEPVKGRGFDLILANLPYVISPENKLIYRDATGDAYLHQLIHEIPAYLTEGGFAQLLSNWIHGKDEPWWVPLEKTLEELSVDTWLIRNGSLGPEAYADWWLRNDSRFKNNKRKYAKTKKDWVEWYREQGIEKIAIGDIALRRRASGPSWISSSSLTRVVETPAGEQLVRMFETQDYLADLPDDDTLLEAVLLPVEMEIRPEEDTGTLKAVTTAGLSFQAGISPLTAEVIRGLDGRTSLRTAIQKTGQAGEDGLDLDPTLLLEIQILLGMGMLVPSLAG